MVRARDDHSPNHDHGHNHDQDHDRDRLHDPGRGLAHDSGRGGVHNDANAGTDGWVNPYRLRVPIEDDPQRVVDRMLIDGLLTGDSVEDLIDSVGGSMLHIVERLGDEGVQHRLPRVRAGMAALLELQLAALRKKAAETLSTLCRDRAGQGITQEQARALDVSRRACSAILRLRPGAENRGDRDPDDSQRGQGSRGEPPATREGGGGRGVGGEPAATVEGGGGRVRAEPPAAGGGAGDGRPAPPSAGPQPGARAEGPAPPARGDWPNLVEPVDRTGGTHSQRFRAEAGGTPVAAAILRGADAPTAIFSSPPVPEPRMRPSSRVPFQRFSADRRGESSAQAGDVDLHDHPP